MANYPNLPPLSGGAYPQPPQRPTFDEWTHSSERARIAYDTALEAYLLMACDAQTYATLYALRDFSYAWWRERGEIDPNWKCGGTGVRHD